MERFEDVRQRILLANSEPEIVYTLETFLGGMLPSETLGLPDEARELLRSEPDLVPESAVSLKKQELMYEGGREARELLHSLALIYEAASNRIGALRARRLRP